MFSELPFIFKFGSYQIHSQVFKIVKIGCSLIVVIIDSPNMLNTFSLYTMVIDDVYNCSQSPSHPVLCPSPHSSSDLVNYFSWVKHGANRPGSQLQNFSEPVSITEKEILPHLLIAPLTPASAFARCMWLVLQGEKRSVSTKSLPLLEKIVILRRVSLEVLIRHLDCF